MKRILFVDDDQMVLRLIERKMKGTDIKCHFANSGEEALKWMKQFHIDVMVTDVMMPDMNGLELSSKAKDISHIPCGLFSVATPMFHRLSMRSTKVMCISILLSHGK